MSSASRRTGFGFFLWNHYDSIGVPHDDISGRNYDASALDWDIDFTERTAPHHARNRAPREDGELPLANSIDVSYVAVNHQTGQSSALGLGGCDFSPQRNVRLSLIVNDQNVSLFALHPSRVR